jgi:ankyrin repeat protein
LRALGYLLSLSNYEPYVEANAMASTPQQLFDAIETGDVDGVRAVLAEDASLASARDAAGVSALLRARYRLDRALTAAVREHVGALDAPEAAAFGELDRLTELLEADPSLVETRTPDGFTLLHLAAFFAGADVVRLLLARGVDPDGHGTGWMTGTALHSAVSARDAEAVRALLDAGTDPNARQQGGYTPLQGAAHNGDEAIVRMLLDAGADPSLTNDEGRDARAFAEEGGDQATISLVGKG